MNKFIYHFPAGEIIHLHADARPIHLGLRDGIPTIWFEVDKEKPKCQRRTKIVATGEPVPEDGKHIGTVIEPIGLVWHIYDMGTYQ